MIGGPQGSGVESGATIFSQVCAKVGYQVFGKREFYSNIKGEHSYFAVRVADKPIHSNVKGVNLLTSFDAETIFRHYDEVYDTRGGIIYDSELEDTDTDKVHTLDAAFKERLHKRLDAHNTEHTIGDILRHAQNNGVLLYPVSFKGILDDLAQKLDNPKLNRYVRLYNTISVTLSLGLVDMPIEPLQGAIDDIFVKKPEVAELNKQVASIASPILNAAKDTKEFPHTLQDLTATKKEPNTILIQGHLGTALGKMASGCRFQSYYPITPASDESVYLEANEILDVTDNRPGSTAIIQTEDEICAIGMAIGSALTGTRSATCTSGPGFSLMTEALGWAGINEVPIVITDYQRSGPSTGLPTRHGQDDLLSVIYAGHGEFPKIVYASGSVEESFYDTTRCFNYSDEFQIPVIHMMDKFLASTVLTCKRFDTQKVTIRRGKMLEDKLPHQQDGDEDSHDDDGNNSNNTDTSYKRFEFTDDGISPRAKLGMDDKIFWNTGDESDEIGHITEDPILRNKMMEKRMSRLDLILDRVPKEEQIRSFGIHDITIVTWGSTIGPIIDAIDMLKQRDGIRVGLVQVKMLNPFPVKAIAELFDEYKRNGNSNVTLVDIEANYIGQLGVLMTQNLKCDMDYYILKYTGRSMTCTEVYDALKKIKNGSAKKREVLTYGA